MVTDSVREYSEADACLELARKAARRLGEYTRTAAFLQRKVCRSSRGEREG